MIKRAITTLLSEHKGKFVLIFFYPKSFIPYSAKEVAAFEKAYQSLNDRGVVVYGISGELPKMQTKFHKAFSLTYDLLSDPTESVLVDYGATSTFFGRKFISYLIGPDGRVARKYSKESPSLHPFLALNDLPQT